MGGGERGAADGAAGQLGVSLVIKCVRTEGVDLLTFWRKSWIRDYYVPDAACNPSYLIPSPYGRRGPFPKPAPFAGSLLGLVINDFLSKVERHPFQLPA